MVSTSDTDEFKTVLELATSDIKSVKMLQLHLLKSQVSEALSKKLFISSNLNLLYNYNVAW